MKQEPKSRKATQKQNVRMSCRKLEHLLRESFPARGLLVTLEHQRTPSSRFNSILYVKDWLRLAKVLYKKSGLPFQYIYATEWNGRAGAVVHRAIVAPAGTAALLEQLGELWEFGNCGIKDIALGEQSGSVARLLMRQHLEAGANVSPSGRMWSPCFGLEGGAQDATGQ